jgi:hypothetical protein
MSRRARVLALLAALLALPALAVAGCGGDSAARDDYVRSVNDAQNQLAKRFSSLQAQIRPTSTPAQDRRTLEAYEAAVQRAVTDLRGVDPPSGFGDLHRRFIGDIADYGTEVRRARGALDSGRPKEVMAAQQRLVTAVGRISARINDTIAAINRKLKD